MPFTSEFTRLEKKPSWPSGGAFFWFSEYGTEINNKPHLQEWLNSQLVDQTAISEILSFVDNASLSSNAVLFDGLHLMTDPSNGRWGLLE